MRLALLVLAICLYVGCAPPPPKPVAMPPEREVQAMEWQLESYHLELANLVASGQLSQKEADRFYQIARVETARRIARLADQHPTFTRGD
jgi:hypothetical protein